MTGLLLPSREVLLWANSDLASLVDIARDAEAAGYDSAWVGDSLLARPRGEPLTLLAAVAGATERVRLGTAVMLPLLRHPVSLAHQLATVDRVSRGRLIVGIGPGAELPGTHAELKAVGVPSERRVTDMLAAVDRVRRLWRGEEAGIDLQPRPFDPGGPPVWVGGTGPRMLRMTGEHFEGWLPMPNLGERDAFLTADYNAEMIEHIARFPRVRDRAIFIGRPEDIVPDTFGAGLPEIRAWTEKHYEFSGGYILGLEGSAIGDRRQLRSRLGYSDDEVVCIASVGGSGVGTGLLSKVMRAFPAARQRIPKLRMIAVAGPRIDPSTLPKVDGVEVRAFMPDLNLHLAACDVALSQGGLSTTMELVAARRPFIYFPLIDHCEQNFHVRYRLERYRAGTCMDFEAATPDRLATEIESLLARPVDFVEVETGTAARTASMIAELL